MPKFRIKCGILKQSAGKFKRLIKSLTICERNVKAQVQVNSKLTRCVMLSGA